jgi:hypothetical protein
MQNKYIVIGRKPFSKTNYGVINEYIKYTTYDMLHIYVLLFNIILDKGIISESWGKGILIPILNRYQCMQNKYIVIGRKPFSKTNWCVSN